MRGGVVKIATFVSDDIDTTGKHLSFPHSCYAAYLYAYS